MNLPSTIPTGLPGRPARPIKPASHLLQQFGSDVQIPCLGTWQFATDPAIAERERSVINRLEEFADDIVERMRSGSGLILIGAPQRGKTFCGACLSWAAVTATGWPVEYVSAADLLMHNPTRAYEMMEAKFLFIRDLGTNGKSLDVAMQNSLFTLIDHRTRRRLSTVVEIEAESLLAAESIIGPRVYVRLATAASPVLFDFPARQHVFQETL